jgi:nitrous oxidase accessory protein NosD
VKRNIVTLSLTAVLLFSATGLMFVGLAEANPWPAPPIRDVYIRSNGIVDPPTVPIQRRGNIYTFTGDLKNATITVECDNIIIDGAGFSLQGNGQYWNAGFTLTNRSNVVIQNMDIRDYVWSVYLDASSNVIVYNNSMLTAWNVWIVSSFSNQIVGNNITGEDTGFGYCVHIENGAADNLIIGNNFVEAGVAVTIYSSSGKNNTFYHNNFINNSNNAGGWIEDEEANVWDNGVEGNFWSDYTGVDADGDGISDTPYIIDDVRPDRHPLMSPFNVSSVLVKMPEWANPPDPEEPVPTVPVAVTSAATIVVVSAVLLVYLKKRKRYRGVVTRF